MKALLFDAVSLRHFAAIERLDLLKTHYESLGEPRWTDAVKGEILRTPENIECARILAAEWLGEPIAPNHSDHAGIQRLRLVLGGGASDREHLGESESIHFAMKHDYHFLTDDREAHKIACNRLGHTRTFDTIKVLIDAAAMGEITLDEASAMANRIRDSGRYLLESHPAPVTATYLRSLC